MAKGDLVRAAEGIEDRVEAAEEAAEEAAIQNEKNEPEPQPQDDNDHSERLARLEEAQKQPPQDPRVDSLLASFGQLTDRLGEALSDSVAEVEEVTPDPEPAANAFVEQVEEAPKRVHSFLRRLW